MDVTTAEVCRVENGSMTGVADALALFDVDEQGAALFSGVDLQSRADAAFLEALVASDQRRGGVVIDLSAARRRSAAA